MHGRFFRGSDDTLLNDRQLAIAEGTQSRVNFGHGRESTFVTPSSDVSCLHVLTSRTNHLPKSPVETGAI